MPSYFFYILRQLVGPLVVVTLSLTAMIWLTQSLRFLDLIINKGLSFTIFLSLTALLVPSLLSSILPIALLAAVLYTYHRMSGDSEIVVLRAAGLRNLRIAAPALVLAVAVVVFGYAVSLHLMPAGFRAFKDLQFEIRHNYASVLIQEGVFNTPVDRLTIYVRERDSEGRLHGILVHDNRDVERPATMMAERGALIEGDDGPRFVLFNGNRQVVESGRGQLSLLYFDRYSFPFGAEGEEPQSRTRESKERFLSELMFPEPSLGEQQYREFYAELHHRLTSPLHSLAFALIALAAMLHGPFNRRGQSWRLLAAVMVAVVYQAIALALVSLTVRMPALAVLQYLNVAAMVGLGAYVLAAERPIEALWRRSPEPAAG